MDLDASLITVTWELVKPHETRKILKFGAGEVNCYNKPPPEQVIIYLATATTEFMIRGGNLPSQGREDVFVSWLDCKQIIPFCYAKLPLHLFYL